MRVPKRFQERWQRKNTSHKVKLITNYRERTEVLIIELFGMIIVESWTKYKRFLRQLLIILFSISITMVKDTFTEDVEMADRNSPLLLFVTNKLLY